MAFTDSFAWSDLTSAHIPNFIWIITGLGFLVYIYSSIWSWFRLRHIPGPAFASISSFWLCKTQLSGNAFVELKNVNDKYGWLMDRAMFGYDAHTDVSVDLRCSGPHWAKRSDSQ